MRAKGVKSILVPELKSSNTLKKILNACKKTLALEIKVGVASASVQGLEP
jgi:hypothetical protein